MKLLLCVGEGLGNIIQVLPLAKALKLNDINFDILNLSNCPTGTVSWLFKEYAEVVKELDTKEYAGRIELGTTRGSLFFANRMEIPCANDPAKQFFYKANTNEIETYLLVLEDLGLPIPKGVFDVDLPTIEKNEKHTFDFVVHNGCTLHNKDFWARKKYKNMEELVERLLKGGFTVACIGAPTEYIGIGTNMTGLPIEESASIIANSKLFISNDTGTYHLAAALKKQGIVLFTATSVINDNHPTFHRTIKVVKTKLDCQPCRHKPSWDTCTNYKCRDIPVDLIIKEIRNEELEL